MSRYLMRCFDVGVEVYDATTGSHDTAMTVFGPASYETASRVAADMNLREPQPAASPSCNCTAERYRVALCKIARHSECRYTRDIADEALAAAGRMKEEGDAV